MNKRKILFIVNPYSGTSNKASIASQVNKTLDFNLFDVSIKYTEYASHAVFLCKEAVENQVNIVVAVGGDGTINEVASELVHTETALAIIPMGSGNGFAAHLNIPKNIAKCIQIINKGFITKIDTCRLNNEFYINVAGVGFDGYVANLIKGKSSRGRLLYLYNMMLAMIQYRSKRYSLHIEGQEIINKKYYCIAVANASIYGYQFKIAPDANLRDGYLDVVFIKNAPLYKHLLSILYFFRGRSNQLKHIETIRTKHLTIKAKNIIDYHIDGEGRQTKDWIEFKINPQSLYIIQNKD